jgi:hypothetical protein
MFRQQDKSLNLLLRQILMLKMLTATMLMATISLRLALLLVL